MRTLILFLLFSSSLAFASEGSEAIDWAPALPVGSSLPEFRMPDHTGTQQTNDSIKGRNGTVYFFNRSTSW